MYIPTQLTQQFQILEFSAEDITSDYRFLLRLVNIFTIDTEEYHPVCYKVNDAKTFKTPVYYFMLANHHVYDRLNRLTRTFKIIAIDFQCYILSGIRRTSNYIAKCVGSFSICKAKKGQQANIESINQSRITQKEYLLIWNSETTQKPKHLSS